MVFNFSGLIPLTIPSVVHSIVISSPMSRSSQGLTVHQNEASSCSIIISLSVDRSGAVPSNFNSRSLNISTVFTFFNPLTVIFSFLPLNLIPTFLAFSLSYLYVTVILSPLDNSLYFDNSTFTSIY